MRYAASLVNEYALRPETQIHILENNIIINYFNHNKVNHEKTLSSEDIFVPGMTSKHCLINYLNPDPKGDSNYYQFDEE